MHLNMADFTNIPALYFAVIAIVLTTMYYVLTTRGLPPGPMGIPYLGYWPFMKTTTCHHQLLEMKKKYGDVSSFTVSGHLYINLGTVKAMREALFTRSDSFNFRMRDFNLLSHSFFDGVAFAEGEKWKVLRKFFIQQFKERGFSSFKESRSGSIYDVIKGSVEDLRKTKEKPVDIIEILAKRINHILKHMLFDEDGISDQELKEIVHSYEIVLENMTGPNLLLLGTLAKYVILPFTQGYQQAMEHNALIRNTMQAVIDRHRSNFDQANLHDIIDMYLKEKSDRQSRNDPTAQYFTDSALVGSVFQFIGDGITTVAVFICAFFRALVDHPEEQEKIYEELAEVVGQERDPSVEDKSKLPYTNAFILEVVRTCDIFPFFPDLECTRETTIQGCRIPKGAILLLNSWAAHYDPNEYEDPNRFNPSRFIAEEGKKKPEPPVLFGMGKRACIGEGYAMIQAFLFVTTIVKHFRLSKAPGAKEKFLFLVGKLEVCIHPRDP